MSELAVMIQYTGIKAKFLEVYKQRARCFRHAFLSFDLRDLRMRRPNYVYLVDWDTAHVKCVWRKSEDAIQRLRAQFKVVHTDTALLSALDIARIDIVEVHPLPESLIPGVPDTLSLPCKRRVARSEDDEEHTNLKRPKLEPDTSSDRALLTSITNTAAATGVAADKDGPPLNKQVPRHGRFLHLVRADVNPDPSATVVLSPDIVICNPLDNGKDPTSEKAALRLAIRQTYSEYMVHYEASKDVEEDIAHMDAQIRFLMNKKAWLLARAASQV